MTTEENVYRDVLFSLKDHNGVHKKIIDCKYTQSIGKNNDNMNDSIINGISDCPSNKDNVFTFLSNIENSLKNGNESYNNSYKNSYIAKHNNNTNNNSYNKSNSKLNSHDTITNKILGIVLLIVDPKYSLIEESERYMPLKKLSANMIEKIPFLIKNSVKNAGHDEIIKEMFNIKLDTNHNSYPEVVYSYISTYSSKRITVFHIDEDSVDYVKYEYTKTFPDGENFYIVKVIKKDFHEYHLFRDEEFSDRILLDFILKGNESVNAMDYSKLCKIYKILSFNNKRCTKKEKTENILALISNKDE